MILTITPNACVDKTYRVEGFALDRVNRPSQAYTVAGGKGVNVARVYQTLGGVAIATGFVGGINGRILTRALGAEKIQDAFVRVKGESRVCIAVIDPQTGTQTEINENGPEIDARSVRALLRNVTRLLSQNTFEFVVMSGSLPPGVPPTLYADIIEIARKAGVRTVLDASGAALKAGLRACPWMAKPNLVELESVVGRTLDNARDALRAAHTLHEEHNIAVVAFTRGSEGATLIVPGETWQAVPPSIEFASAVASGDSFLAAFLWAWAYGDRSGNAEHVLRLATGAGAANAATIGAGFCTRESIEGLAAQTLMERVE